ncbi:MAG: hypothetical protein JSW65_05960 [Candidatus Bipolaricaulota bacterium]|nr:MAG: hypothetical protein JSW65_05960 [Candidatus Bipolaricaulota bacterium]
MESIEHALREVARQGTMPCTTAFEIVDARGASPLAVGEAATSEDLRIIRCQLGLFGYREFGSKGLTPVALEVPGWLEEKMQEALVDGSLPCAAAWQIADESGLPRLTVAAAAETLGVRIASCQLGCF